jgi:hypothetical protein
MSFTGDGEALQENAITVELAAAGAEESPPVLQKSAYGAASLSKLPSADVTETLFDDGADYSKIRCVFSCLDIFLGLSSISWRQLSWSICLRTGIEFCHFIAALSEMSFQYLYHGKVC